MRADINITIPDDKAGDAFDRAFASKQATVVPKALEKTLDVIRDNVIDKTPRYKGRMRSAIVHTQTPYAGGKAEGTVFATPSVVDPVIVRVMEKGANWTKLPPWAPLFEWVTNKLGLSGKDAARATAAIRWKIRRRGIHPPLAVSGMGAMFDRTFKLMQASRFHFGVFYSTLRQLLGK